MEVRFRWTCPHCGFEQGGYADVPSQHQDADRLVHCDDEEGGCGRLVAIKVAIEVKHKVYMLVDPQQAQ
jgi:hypothetical protein